MEDEEKSPIEIYCDGANMAYLDCAGKVLDLINNAPPVLKDILSCLLPLADAMRTKSETIYQEAKFYINGVRQ